MPIVLRWILRLGPTNPITVRLVQGGSRRRRHLYIRTIYLGVMIVALLYFLIFNAGASGNALDYGQMARAAAGAFVFIAYMQIALICMLAPVFMAGAIAQEANPKTWDILLTTPLSAGEIVLGNLFGRLFFILALLLSTLPLFALTQYFGGVPGTSIFMSYLIAACATLLVGTIAIALSVSRLVGKRAVFAFYVSVISYLAVTWALDSLVGSGRVTYMTAINPFLALRALLSPSGYPSADPGSHTGPAAWFLERPVTTWCVLSGGISVALMVVSTFTVRLGGLTQFSSTGRSSVPWYRRMFGLSRRGDTMRPARNVWNNAIAWREAAARNATLGRMLARWSFIAAGGLLGLGVVLYFHGGNMTTSTFRDTVLYTVLGEIAVIALVAVNMAATAVAREREDGTLDLLLTTPITPGAYLTGKMRGLVAYLLPLLAVPLGTLLIAGLYVGLANWGVLDHPGGLDGSASPYAVNWAHQLPTSTGQMNKVSVPAVLPEAGLVEAIVTIPFMAFCVMVGLQWSLKSKGSIGSVVATVGVVGVVAGIAGLCAWQAASDLPVLGPAAAGLNPAVAALAGTQAESAMQKTIENSSNAAAGVTTARVGLFIGSFVAAALWLAAVYGIHANMVRTFDMTVRRLAGTR